jgi:kinesin family protein 5
MSCIIDPSTDLCVHRVDADNIARKIVELKLQLHYLSETAKQSMNGEHFQVVLENSVLKTRLEEFEFQENLSNVRCNQLEMKNKALETRLMNQEQHITCLQTSLQEYQTLFKQQIIMSQVGWICDFFCNLFSIFVILFL